MKVYPGRLNGFVKPPSAKSITHRALMLASFSEIGSVIKNPLIAGDTDSTKFALEKLGVRFKSEENFFQLLETTKTIDREDKSDININCFNSGTTLRLLSGIVAQLSRKVTLQGDQSLNSRPMDNLIQALKKIGVKTSSDSGTPPVTITGPSDNAETKVEIAGHVSSQFISSLLMHGALRPETQLEVNITPPIVSRPYIDLTVSMLRDLGVSVDVNEDQYVVTGVEKFKKSEFLIPMDYSSAAFFIAAGALPENRIVIDGIDNELPQADKKIIEIVKEMGASVSIQKNANNRRITIQGNKLQGIEINLQEAPDLFPIVSVLGLSASGQTTITGAHHLAFKETNRIESMITVIKELGGEIEPLEDGAIVRKSELKGGTVNSFDDHRIAMATAIASTQSKHTVIIENSDCVNVSYPTFFNDLNRLH
ncbi:MAG: 3-phosphoshikimate 1-carboxyvinyltransferase [Candidatus Heimdallarchaeota archaeon]|nr:3-phosphoshikimate 1-carboxyvinyltransferase [Candidatus Heimdallarchaeota archaeon]